MERTPFIGTGHNPQGVDLPLGFGMQLPQHPQALDTFSRMTEAEKAALVAYVKQCSTGGEAEAHIGEAIRRLERGEKTF